MAARGARVTGIDVSPRLVQLAREKDPNGTMVAWRPQGIDYRVSDLSRWLSVEAGRFDVVGSYLVLNDVADYRGFVATMAAALKPGGRAVVSLNNPYAYVVRKGIADYFATGTAHPSGLAAAGIKVHFYHRTLGEYLDAFLAAGFQLTNLVDVDHPGLGAARAAGKVLGKGEQLPRFLVLAFRKT
jgi:2-polyprenyl-3-methyl-5-hydroxy-6-metoxy-1,4-benzoquinol methylase